MAAELKARFEAGASIRSLAENTGRSYGSVHGQSADAEVALRSHGGATRGDAAS
ncbi:MULTISPECIES: helix-turn-helix domain-containing protein [unclassified Streptomyces]|uniref:helix-turn-helix domain-containing protein n=1 Tax=unclassified Streptomyces TaxID=2593676 RepID=UPI003813F0D4